MRKLISVILVAIITVMAASAEWRSIILNDASDSYVVVEFEDSINIHTLEEATTCYNMIQESLIPELQEGIKDVQKDVLYTKGCEYAKVHGACFFQETTDTMDLIVLQPNGYYTVYSFEED